MSMRVERVGVDAVREQLEALKRKKEGLANYGTAGRRAGFAGSPRQLTLLPRGCAARLCRL